MIKAYSYIRFSTSEQAKGHSLQRQTASSEEYAKKNNLYLDNSLNMNDLGISAYTGDNVLSGALGSFFQAIDEGKIDEGSYLLVESLDRLSRQSVHLALSQFLNIINKKIIIVTLVDQKKYCHENLDVTDLIISLTIMSRAHEESKTKALRVQAAWDNKHENIHTKKLTAWAPKWVYLSDDRTEFLLHKDRVEIIKAIFQWAIDGFGTNLIVQELEKRGIEPWESINANEPIRRIPKRWYTSYIQRILADRSVLGEFKSKRKLRNDKNVIIDNYFPQIISEKTFYQVQHIRESRNVRKKGTGAGRKGKYLSNLFSGMLYCGYSIDNNKGNHRCDGTNEKFVFTNKGNHLQYLQCSKIKSGSSGCTACRKMWRYDAFEKSFLTHINDIDVSVLLGNSNELELSIINLNNEEKSIYGEISNIDIMINKFTDAILESKNSPKSIIERINNLESEKDVFQKKT